MISAVVLAKNEEKNIRDCLKSLSFCDEVVVVDDNSEDLTRDISQKIGVKVHIRDMDMDYSAQSNFGIGKAKGEWILFVDADERITRSLREEIKQVISSPTNKYNGFYFNRIDFMWGKWLKHGEVGSTKVLRLFRKGAGEWRRRVHPTFNLRGGSSQIRNPILHYPHQNLREFLESVNRWSTWHAVANKEEGKTSSLFKIISMPAAHFFRNFFLRMGFLDGMQGFIFATVMSFHSFLAWSKVWMLQKGYIKI